MKRFLLCLFVTSLCISCSNSDDSDSPNGQIENFYALTVGNSWVYKNYRYNPNTEDYDDTGVIDSVSIIGTEVVSGDTFYKFRRWTTGNEDNITFCNPNGEHFELLREVDGNLVRDDGSIKFTNSDTAERVLSAQSWGTLYETLVDGESPMTVEAGSFSCIHSERYARNPEGEQMDGLDRFYYSDGVGLIYDTSSFVTNPVPSIVRRLDSYEVQ